LGAATSRIKYDGTTPTDVSPTKEVPSYAIRMRLPEFKTMLMENGKITLPRFQKFAWTWIGTLAYLGTLYVVVVGSMTDFAVLSVPELPTLFVGLMGLSGATYLIAKGTKGAFISINEVKHGTYGKVNNNGKMNNKITVLGSSFGRKGTVWIEYYPPLDDEEKKRYYQPFGELR
jgi:hypothetical protein